MQPDLVIFLDENHCCNKRVLGVLAERGIMYERFIDHFARGLADSEWLPSIGKRGWTVLTSDGKIRYRSIEKQAVYENKIRMFCFSTNNMSGQDMANALNQALDRIIKVVASIPPPFIATITKSGTVNVREDFSETSSTSGIKNGPETNTPL
jgi:hypothetical protein